MGALEPAFDGAGQRWSTLCRSVVFQAAEHESIKLQDKLDSIKSEKEALLRELIETE